MKLSVAPTNFIDLGAAREDCDAYGVGYNEQGYEQQHDGNPDPDHGNALAQVDKLFYNTLTDANVGDVVELFNVIDRLRVQFEVDDFQMVRVAQRVVFVEAVEQDRLFLKQLLVFLQRLRFGDKRELTDIGDFVQLFAHRRDFGFGGRFVNKHDDFVLLLHLHDKLVKICDYEHGAAHDDQAGSEDAHGRKAHQAVFEKSLYAVLESAERTASSHMSYPPFLSFTSTPWLMVITRLLYVSTSSFSWVTTTIVIF